MICNPFQLAKTIYKLFPNSKAHFFIDKLDFGFPQTKWAIPFLEHFHVLHKPYFSYSLVHSYLKKHKNFLWSGLWLRQVYFLKNAF